VTAQRPERGRFSSYQDFIDGQFEVARSVVGAERGDWNGKVGATPYLGPDKIPMGASLSDGTMLLNQTHVSYPLQSVFENPGIERSEDERVRIRNALKTVFHEDNHLMARAGSRSRKEATSTLGNPGVRELEEGVTEAYAYSNLDRFIGAAGLDEVVPGIDEVEADGSYSNLAPAANALAQGIGTRTGLGTNKVLEQMTRVHHEEKWDVATDLMYDSSRLRDVLRGQERETAKARVRDAMRKQFVGLNDLRIDPATGVTRAAVRSTSADAGKRSFASGVAEVEALEREYADREIATEQALQQQQDEDRRLEEERQREQREREQREREREQREARERQEADNGRNHDLADAMLPAAGAGAVVAAEEADEHLRGDDAEFDLADDPDRAYVTDSEPGADPNAVLDAEEGVDPSRAYVSDVEPGAEVAGQGEDDMAGNPDQAFVTDTVPDRDRDIADIERDMAQPDGLDDPHGQVAETDPAVVGRQGQVRAQDPSGAGEGVDRGAANTPEPEIGDQDVQPVTSTTDAEVDRSDSDRADLVGDPASQTEMDNRDRTYRDAPARDESVSPEPVDTTGPSRDDGLARDEPRPQQDRQERSTDDRLDRAGDRVETDPALDQLAPPSAVDRVERPEPNQRDEQDRLERDREQVNRDAADRDQRGDTGQDRDDATDPNRDDRDDPSRDDPSRDDRDHGDRDRDDRDRNDREDPSRDDRERGDGGPADGDREGADRDQRDPNARDDRQDRDRTDGPDRTDEPANDQRGQDQRGQDQRGQDPRRRQDDQRQPNKGADAAKKVKQAAYAADGVVAAADPTSGGGQPNRSARSRSGQDTVKHLRNMMNGGQAHAGGAARPPNGPPTATPHGQGVYNAAQFNRNQRDQHTPEREQDGGEGRER